MASSGDRLVLFLADVSVVARPRIEGALAGSGARVEFWGADPPDDRLASAEVIVGWRAQPHQLKTAEALRLFVTPAAGVQGLVPLFRELVAMGRPVRLANSHGNAPMVAQHAVALLLSITNALVTHDRWMRAGLWRRGDSHLASAPLGNLNVGLLGYGAMNHATELRLAPFGCHFARLRSGHTPAERARFFEEADAVIAAVPLTDATRGLVGADELSRLGARGFLVNLARGAVVDEDALYEALAARRIAAAALDVWYEYDPVPDDTGARYPYRRPFHELENVVMSPHRAASPLDHPARWDDVTSIIGRYLRGLDVNVVDLERGY